MGNFRGSSWRIKNKTILKTNEGTIRTENVQIVYEYNEICGQINVDVLAYKQEAKNCVTLFFARSQIRSKYPIIVHNHRLK